MQIINVEGLETEKKALELRWGSTSGNIISVLVIVAILTFFWLGASAIFSKDARSVERYEVQLKSLTSTQTNKVFNEITNDPKSIRAAKADFKKVAMQVKTLEVPEPLKTIHQDYVELYGSFYEDSYWEYQDSHAKDHTKINSSVETLDALWRKHDKDWSKVKRRFIYFNERLDKLNLQLIELHDL